jgi:hypothetical protein
VSSTATNRSAALAGAWSAVGGVAYSSILGHLPSYEVVLFWLNLLMLGAIFFVPFFKWVIGADFKANGQGFTLREQWLALPEKSARIGIWFISACTVGVALTFVSRALSQ